jgi:hypothetical protein
MRSISSESPKPSSLSIRSSSTISDCVSGSFRRTFAIAMWFGVGFEELPRLRTELLHVRPNLRSAERDGRPDADLVGKVRDNDARCLTSMSFIRQCSWRRTVSGVGALTPCQKSLV